jgi:hypothetical protein
MSNEWRPRSKGLAFVDGSIENRNRIAFACHSIDALKKNKQLSRLVFWEIGDKWIDGGQFTWTAVGVAAGRETIVLGRNGEVAVWRASKVSEERITVPGRTIGPLRGVRYVGKEVFAYGMGRQLYRRVGEAWLPFENGLKKAPAPTSDDIDALISAEIEDVSGITAVDGPSANNIYAVGFEGEIYHSTGSAWAFVHSPTDVILRDLAVAPDGNVFACGQMGMILRLRGTTCEVVKYDGPEGLDFFSIACLENKLFLADGQSLHVLDSGVLSLVDFGLSDGTPPSSSLDEKDGMILSVAGSEVYTSRDGASWDPLLN